MQLNGLICVSLGTTDVVDQIEDLQKGQEPVKVLQLPYVEIIIGKPVRPVRACAILVNQGHEEGAHVIPQGDGDPEQGSGGALHALGGLVIEELEVADGHESLGDPVEAILRGEPEHRDRYGGMGQVGKPVVSSSLLPLNLDEAGDESGQDGDGEADAHAVEDGDAAVKAGEAAGDRDNDAVVEDDGEEHSGHGEDGHGSGRDLEGPGETAVHGLGLLEREGILLGVGGEEEDPGGPYRAHTNHLLQLFHPVDGVQPP